MSEEENRKYFTDDGDDAEDGVSFDADERPGRDAENIPSFDVEEKPKRNAKGGRKRPDRTKRRAGFEEEGGSEHYGIQMPAAIRNMNLPNKLTCLRMLLIVPFVLCMLLGRAEGVWRWFSLVIFCAAAATDTLDGYIARRDHLITDFGKFMDPLADKILVVSAMICLVDLGRMPAWILIIIIAREFAISGFRLIASDNGIVIAASMWGKAKTVSQMAAVILLIVNPATGIWRTITLIVLYAALILTVVSLVDYIYKNKQVLSMQK